MLEMRGICSGAVTLTSHCVWSIRVTIRSSHPAVLCQANLFSTRLLSSSLCSRLTKLSGPQSPAMFTQPGANRLCKLSSFSWSKTRGACQRHVNRILAGVGPPNPVTARFSSSLKEVHKFHLRTRTIYVCAVGVFMLGMSFAGVPLYRMFCQATGLGGVASQGHDESKVENMEAVQNRLITVRFNADVASSMRWNFKPQQTEVKVHPGETALAFYTARNPSDVPIIGISTYNVVPFEAGQYFNKIQCFCFEEQRLNPHEQVDMPVFFYLDPEFAEDPRLAATDTITLSYTFFEAKEGFQVPLPGYMTKQAQAVAQ